jgi:hypothetical protein
MICSAAAGTCQHTSFTGMQHAHAPAWALVTNAELHGEPHDAHAWDRAGYVHQAGTRLTLMMSDTLMSWLIMKSITGFRSFSTSRGLACSDVSRCCQLHPSSQQVLHPLLWGCCCCMKATCSLCIICILIVTTGARCALAAQADRRQDHSAHADEAMMR